MSHPASFASRRDRLNILVANKCRTSQRILSKIFGLAGHDSSFVEDCADALHVLEKDEAFDIILIHVNMPTEEDIEVIKLFRFMSCGQSPMPAIVLTTDASEKMRHQPLWQEWAQLGLDIVERTQIDFVCSRQQGNGSRAHLLLAAAGIAARNTPLDP